MLLLPRLPGQQPKVQSAYYAHSSNKVPYNQIHHGRKKSLVENATGCKNATIHQLFLYDVCFDCWENKESKQWYYCIGAKGSQVKIFIALFISLPCDDGS